MNNATFDYIIVGAGSAGCVLANRITEDADRSVLLLEYGGNDSSIFVQMPTALQIPMNMPRFNWGFWSEPEPNIDNRLVDVSRGKGLGGSSSINGMIYVRGNACDLDQWEELGAQGWAYRDCLPYYKKSGELRLRRRRIQRRGRAAPYLQRKRDEKPALPGVYQCGW